MGFTISKNQGSGRTVTTVTPEEKNATDKDIVQILTVEAVDGSTKEVKLIHKKGEGNYDTFRVSPTELYFEPTGESKEVTIVSTKQMVINGKKVGDPVNVNYTRENSGDVSGSGTTLIMRLNDNTHNDKLGQVIFIQDESGKTVVVTCRQGKKENTARGDIGLIQLWSGSGVPEGYVLCDGSQVSIAEYPELYKAIGDKYNTASTKAGYISVPDLRGRFVVGYDPRNYEYERIGNTGGQALVTGGGSAHENRPPYYVLAYVMKIR